ncbi:EamA family transporter [Niallia sp. 03133]|uniref:EamA family transporter n=1 Tax=Niallia sp. 03133 TaxID=3458060 RepID=UPI00404463E7
MFVTVLGFVLWYYGVSKVPVSTSAVFTGVIAVSALLFSYIFLRKLSSVEAFSRDCFCINWNYYDTSRNFQQTSSTKLES